MQRNMEREQRGDSLKWRRSFKFLEFLGFVILCGVCECQTGCLAAIHSLTNHLLENIKTIPGFKRKEVILTFIYRHCFGSDVNKNIAL